jgi:predicted HNH restriction endonuclease
MMKVLRLTKTKDETVLLNSVMPGGTQWDRHIDEFGGNCLKSCPHFRRCGEGNGTGPNLVCSSDWQKANLSQRVFDVLTHVLKNFSHYNRGDIAPKKYDKIAHVMYRRLSASEDETYPEGEPRLRWHAYAERYSKAARDKKQKCLASGSLVCEACGIDF